eukprot:TRINITY_DN6698_c0_g2_i3.p1 TRINITY_DN6698_c0_g2~~TRINITY_DN6698_c0_g2_i3.p1  ORF type:complete len:326 (-),score=59.62 TRINITY_DN6698_c0_g2_i3:53-889(-)
MAESSGNHEVWNLVDVADSFGTGDMLLYHGSQLFSRIIDLVTATEWSHNGILVRNPSDRLKAAYKVRRFHQELERLDLKIQQTHPDKYAQYKERLQSKKLDEIYMFDSDRSPEDGRKHGGVQLVPLRYWLSRSFAEVQGKMRVVVRPLQLPSGERMSNERIEPWMLEVADRPFEDSNLGLIKTTLGVNKVEDQTRLHCCEVATFSYKLLGLLPQELNSSNYIPKDFSEEGENDPSKIRHQNQPNIFPLVGGAKLGKNVEIVPDFADILTKDMFTPVSQ